MSNFPRPKIDFDKMTMTIMTMLRLDFPEKGCFHTACMCGSC